MNEIQDANDLLKYKDKKFYICGAGLNGKTLKKWMDINNITVLGFVDKDNKKEINYNLYTYMNIPLNNMENVYFVISSVQFKEQIRRELNKIGIYSNIINFEDIAAFDTIIYDLKKGIAENNKLKKPRYFHNIHMNKRAFIIGNGPSLQINDLNKIKNEITFATNSITDAFRYSDWRPTYYFLEDRSGADIRYKKDIEFVKLLNECNTVMCSKKTSLYDRFASSDYDNLCFYKMVALKKDSEKFFSEDVDKIVYGLGTTVFSMYQFAAYMGIKEIYLIGMDCNFSNIKDKNGEIITNQNIDNYASFIGELKEHKSIYLVDDILLAHKLAKDYAYKHNIKIYNATRGGKLEIFQRVNFASLFER